MPIYKAPVTDTRFVLDEVLDIGRYANIPGFANASPDLVAAILEEAGKFCEEVLQPLNKVGRGVGEARKVRVAADVEDFIENEASVVYRRLVDRHCLPPCQYRPILQPFARQAGMHPSFRPCRIWD